MSDTQENQLKVISPSKIRAQLFENVAPVQFDYGVILKVKNCTHIQTLKMICEIFTVN